MPGLKRKPSLGSSKPSSSAAEPSSSSSKKKPRSDAPAPKTEPSTLVDSQVDFPRGGGTGLTPFEHASTLREARAEIAKSSRGGDDLFSDKPGKAKLSEEDEQKRREAKRKVNREKNNAKKKKVTLETAEEPKRKADKDHIRIEHLNYKRLAPGTRLLCSIAAVHPLALVLSLPNQLVGHVPITSISPLFTQKLHEAAEQDSDDEDDKDSEAEDDEPASGSTSQARLASGLPELRDCFKVGQWVRAAVVNVFGAGVKKGAVPGQEAHEYDRESRRVELTLAPEAINEGVEQGDLAKGFVLPVAIKSREDHGFLLDAGIEGVQGFAPFDQVDAISFYLGQVVDAAITSVASQGRSFTATLKPGAVKAAILGPESAPSSTALVPGCQVNALVTAALPSGLNVKLWGMFDATIDSFHISSSLPAGKEMHDVYKVGSKIKARILWESRQGEMGQMGAESTGPRVVALSAAPHVIAMTQGESASMQEKYPIGAKVEAKVTRTDSDWGLTCSVKGGNMNAFTHISRVSDDHVVKLPSRTGPFALGTAHEARVIGHAPTDRLLLLSFQQSILDKSFMRVNEVEVGSTIKATINRIGANGSAIFLNLGGAFEGVVFPLHFADVVLKKPEKKYKPGATVKARVLNVDSTRNRIVCTLKKSLVQSDLPIVSSLQDARVGVVTQATVSKFVDGNRGIIVDLFGGLRAFVPTSEATEHATSLAMGNAPSLTQHFFEGKVVRVRLTHVDYEQQKLFASVKQASPSYLAKLDVAAVQVGEKVTATVAAVHQDVVVLELQPSKVRGLYSLPMLAAQRGQTVEAVREALQDGETLEDLVVVDKHADRGIVIVGDAKQAVVKKQATLGEPLNAGSVQTGRVQSSPAGGGEPNTVTIALAGGHCRARLHLTDVSDDFSSSAASLPANGESVQVHVLRLRNSGRRADVSMRPSRVTSNGSGLEIKDVEIDKVSDLSISTKVRGFVKAISSAGLFVDLGRNVTARVLISELFDEYVKEWQGRFTVGQLVEGTITAVDVGNGKVEMSLRSNPGQSKKSKADRKAAKDEEDSKKAAQQATSSSSSRPLRLSDLSKGMKVNGFVRAVQEYGVFVQVEGTQISGLAHKSQLSDHSGGATADPTRAFSVGDRVKALVLEVQKGGEGKKGKVDFGLKPSYFSKEDFEEDGEEEEEEDDEDAEDGSALDEQDEDEEMSDAEDDGEDDDDDDDDEEEDDDIEIDTEALLNRSSDDEDDVLKLGGDSDEEDDDDASGEENEDDSEDSEDDEADATATSASAATKSKARPALELSGGFSWSAPEADVDMDAQDDDSDSSDDEDTAATKSKSTLASKAPRVKRGAARPLEDDLTADLSRKAPESATDFERMLLSSPNSSYLWIQFMSFHLQLSEVNKARAVGRRALKVINYREEAEKQNVWIAMLNLENSYGTPEELEKTFKEAVQYNDAKTMHLRLAGILEKTEKVEEARDLWARTTKRFGGADVDVWVLCSQFLLRQGKGDEARALLPRALQALEKSKHITVISRFALNEFKHPNGDIERGRTIYEGLVDSHPKRLDLWWQYIDQEAAAGNVAEVRALFERVLEGRKLSTKKARSVLKKWLDFEKVKGDAKGEREVLERARRFVEEVRRAKGGDEDGEEDGEDDEDDEE